MTLDELKTDIAGLVEENADLRKENARLLAKLTALQSRAAPGKGAVVESPDTGRQYPVRWASGELLTLGDSAGVCSWPHLAAMGWKVVG